MPVYPTNPETQDNNYIQYLKEQLEEAIAEFNEASSLEMEKQTARDNLQEKLEALEFCWDKISETNDRAKDVINVIKNNLDLAGRVACNSGLIKKAIIVQLVETELLADKMIALKEWMKVLVDKLQTQENTGGNGNGTTRNIALAINNLYECIKLTSEQVCNCISQVLEALQLAIELEEILGDPDGHKGITAAMKELLHTIYIGDQLNSTILFPRGKSTNNKEYYHLIKAEHEAIIDELAGKQQEYDDALKDKLLKEAKKDAIEKSKTAAEAASNCPVE